MSDKIWRQRSEYTVSSPEVSELASKLGITPVTALLLYNRNVRDIESAKKFIRLSDSCIYDPFLIKDMDKAATRILKAVENGEKIVIYGDYDVDGVTSVSILYMYLSWLGSRPSYYIPGRAKEGYGVNNEAIDKISQEGASLIITVDTGITAFDEAKYANTLGIDMVITDHHECPELLPEALAVVNIKRGDCPYPFKELAGVGVVFKLICAMEISLSKSEDEKEKRLAKVFEKYIDLVAIGTVADVMPLVDENRLFVSMGLSSMKKNIRPCIRMLLEASGSKIALGNDTSALSSSTISYTLAPRINAAGRMESAQSAVEFFLSDDSEKSRELAIKLCDINRRRQEEENLIVDSAVKKMGKITEDTRIIVLSERDWSSGVIGIVASRITERFGLPCIIISFDENGVGKGSGRSIKGVNLVDALSACSDLLIKFGGHSLAAGLTISSENLEKFISRINGYIKSHSENISLVPTIEYEAELSSREISIKQVKEQEMLEPFGVSNPIPVFRICGALVEDIMELAGGRHTKLTVSKDGISHQVLLFGVPRSTLDIIVSDRVDVLFCMSLNQYKMTTSVQLIARDIKLCRNDVTSDERKKYSELMAGATHYRDEDLLPSRDELAMVYRYIREKSGHTRDDYISVREIISACGVRLGYVKTKIAVNVLCDTELIHMESYDKNNDIYHIGINYVKNKVDIEKSPLLVRLRANMIKR